MYLNPWAVQAKKQNKKKHFGVLLMFVQELSHYDPPTDVHSHGIIRQKFVRLYAA